MIVNTLPDTSRCRGTFTCKYLTFFDPKLKRSFRLPLVHVRVKHDGIGFRTTALIDSGATTSFIPLDIAQLLGIVPPEKTEEAVGAGGVFLTYHGKVDEIDIFKGTKVFCAFKDITISFPAKEGAIPYTILGRDLIFLENDITFREHQEHTIFRQPKK